MIFLGELLLEILHGLLTRSLLLDEHLRSRLVTLRLGLNHHSLDSVDLVDDFLAAGVMWTILWMTLNSLNHCLELATSHHLRQADLILVTIISR